MIFSKKRHLGVKNDQDADSPVHSRPPVADQESWEAFRKGSESAFIDLYNRYFQLLYDYGRQVSGDKEMVKDCIQDVFVTIRNKRKKLPEVSSVKAFLLKCIRNKILTEHTKRSKQRAVDLEQTPLDFLIMPSVEDIMISRQYSQDNLHKIQKSLKCLTQRQREIIYYFYYNNLSYTEIKEVMSFSSVKSARNLLYKALVEIRSAI